MLVMRTNLLKTLGAALMFILLAGQAIADPAGTVSYKKWINMGGDLNALKGDFRFPNRPNFYNVLASLEDPSPDDSNATNDNYGVQLQGYLVPPVSGNYNFYVSSDDQSELYLSTD